MVVEEFTRFFGDHITLKFTLFLARPLNLAAMSDLRSGV